MICIICKTEYYRQTETEPAEPCLCGEMAWGTLWQWDKFRAIYWRGIYILADWILNFYYWLTK